MTPAIIELERAGFAFRLLAYYAEPGAGAFGVEAARALGLPEHQVFKTLLAELDDGGEVVVAIVPVDSMLDLKLLARAAGSKRAAMAAPALAERRTGYVVGGISAFGQRRRHRTFLDASALELDEIHLSGGRRGLDIALAPAVVLTVLDATALPLVRRGVAAD